MMRLLYAETERLWARRITRFFPAVLALLMVGGVAIAFFVIEADDDNTPDFVQDMAGGVEAPDILGPMSALLPIMAFVIGASFIGADVKTGVLEQVLTWEPRRMRLLWAKTISGAVGVAVLGTLLAALFVALIYGLASATGTTDGVTSELWGNIALIVLRTGLASGLFCAFGLGVTVLVNNSTGSIVGFFIYWFIIENLLLVAFLPRVAVYMPLTNAAAFAAGNDVERVEGNVFTGDFETIFHHSSLVAGLILAAWTAASLFAASVVFVKRDIS